MSSADSINGSFLPISVSHTLARVAPVQPSDNRTSESPGRPETSLPLAAEARGRLQLRMEWLAQRTQGEAGMDNVQNRAAINAYRRVADSEERDLVSGLLGVDEYI